MKKHFSIFAKSFLSLTIALSITFPAAALTDQQWSFFNANGINYWYPEGLGGGCVASTNSSYSGANVFSNAELNLITSNRSIYETAANKYGFDWEILATLHSMENSSLMTNPSNGQGVYQLYSYTKDHNITFTPGDIDSEELLRQSEIAAEFLSQIIRTYNINIHSGDGVKRLFYHYNGIGALEANGQSIYHNKAIGLGFSDQQAENGEGSPYVMNKFDIQRDPAMAGNGMNPGWPGMYVSDGVYDSTATLNGYGAYVKYLTLGGNNTSTSTYCVGDANLVPGGMNLAQAKAFMAEYRATAQNDAEYYKYVPSEAICKEGGRLANCVSFSKYFVNKYTRINGLAAFPNGQEVVSWLLNNNLGFANGGHTPRPYAVFSESSTCWKWPGRYCNSGHTGVVLGIDTERNKIIIGEAGCGQPLSWADAREYNLNDFINPRVTYAYTDGILEGI